MMPTATFHIQSALTTTTTTMRRENSNGEFALTPRQQQSPCCCTPSVAKNTTLLSSSPSTTLSPFQSPPSHLILAASSPLSSYASPHSHSDESYLFFSTSLGPKASSHRLTPPAISPLHVTKPSTDDLRVEHSIDFDALALILDPRFDKTLVPYYLTQEEALKTCPSYPPQIPPFDTMAKVTFYSDQTGLIQSLPTANVFEFLQSQSQIWSQLKKTSEYFWFDICQPSPVDLHLLSLLFGLHPLTMEDIALRDPFEKCESFDHYLFYCLRPCDPSIPFSSLAPPQSAFFPDLSQSYAASLQASVSKEASQSGHMTGLDTLSYGPSHACICPSSLDSNPVQHYMVDPNSPWYEKNHLYVLQFPCGIVTIHTTVIPALKSTFEKIAYIYRKSEAGQVHPWTPDYFLFLLIESMLEETKPLLAHLQLECDTINNDLMVYFKPEDRPVILSKIARTRKRLLYLQRLLRPKLDILDQIVDRYSESMASLQMAPSIPVEEELIIRPWTFSNLVNLKEIASYALKQTHSLYEALQHSMTSYCDQVNISMSANSVEADRLMKRLTVLACVLLPPSLIVDFYGMNIPLPGSRRYSSANGHLGPLFIHATVMIAILLVSYAIIRHINRRNSAATPALSRM